MVCGEHIRGVQILRIAGDEFLRITSVYDNGGRTYQRTSVSKSRRRSGSSVAMCLYSMACNQPPTDTMRSKIIDIHQVLRRIYEHD